jgi:hypothetical protein
MFSLLVFRNHDQAQRCRQAINGIRHQLAVAVGEVRQVRRVDLLSLPMR